jgi:hypothetical protein
MLRDIRYRLDKLVGWYERNRPGQSFVLSVPVTWCTCVRWCGNRRLEYHGHTLKPLRETAHCSPAGLKPKMSAEERANARWKQQRDANRIGGAA